MRIAFTSVAVAAMLLIAGMSGAVVAQTEEEDSLFEQLTGTETDDDATLGERIDATTAALASYQDRAAYSVSTTREKLSGDVTDADLAARYAESTKSTFNQNNATLEDYVNARVNANVSDWDTIAVEHRVGEEPTIVYLLSENSSGEFADSRMVNTTNRTVDHTLVLEDNAAESADEELSYFVEDYAADKKDIDRSLITRMQAYADQIVLPEGVGA
ncbi:hypothetical protein [Halolamina sp.]|uniref:hypothetical protein n=1 Tax=Halolamina sp. TaxID=1940283 RepID=UPI00356B4633